MNEYHLETNRKSWWQDDRARIQQRSAGDEFVTSIHRRGHLHAGQQADRAREARDRRDGGTRAKAVGVFGAAAVLGLFVVGFLGMAGAEALDLVLPRWAAMLIMAGVFGVLAAHRHRAGPRMAPLERLEARAHPRVTEGGRPMGETAAETMREIDATRRPPRRRAPAARGTAAGRREGGEAGGGAAAGVGALGVVARFAHAAKEAKGRRPPRPRPREAPLQAGASPGRRVRPRRIDIVYLNETRRSSLRPSRWLITSHTGRRGVGMVRDR